MNQIRSWLCIGKYSETLSESWLLSRNIGAVLQLADPVSYSKISALYLPVEDGVPLNNSHLRQGVAFVLSQKEQGFTTLVACGAGMSRSAVFSIAALKEAEQFNLLDALQSVKQHHSDTLPHPALWLSLNEYYGETVSIHEMVAALNFT